MLPYSLLRPAAAEAEAGTPEPAQEAEVAARRLEQLAAAAGAAAQSLMLAQVVAVGEPAREEGVAEVLETVDRVFVMGYLREVAGLTIVDCLCCCFHWEQAHLLLKIDET